MHRMFPTLRRWGWSLLAAAAFQAGTTQLTAQDVQKDGLTLPPPTKIGDLGGSRLFVVGPNITKTVGMTRPPGATEDPLIEKVHNENPKVARVQTIPGDPRHVLITGLSAGTSRLTFTAKDGREEIFEVRVPSDEEPLREEQRKDFLAAVRKAAPTAAIDAVVMPNNTVVLSGWLASPQDTMVGVACARAIFGAQANVVDTMRVGGVMQVQVECVVAVVNRSKLRNATFNFVMGHNRSYFVGSVLNASTFNNNVSSTGGGGAVSAASAFASTATLPFAILTNQGAFNGFLDALKTEKMAKVQSEPRVITLSGKAAQFISGGETPLLTTSGVGSPSVSYRSFGTTITVLPIVLGNGKIHLDVAPVVSSRNDANGVVIPGAVNTVIPGFDTRGCQVSVQLEDGQTLAIGGMIQHTVNGAVSKIPLLGDMPYLGFFFSSKSFTDAEEELIILVTPRLVDPLACCQLPERLPTRLTRNPDDFELFLEQLLELPRGQRQTCGPNGCYQAGYHNGPTAGAFPCGDATGSLRGRAGCSTCGSGSCSTGTCATGTGVTGGCSNGSCAAGPATAHHASTETPRVANLPTVPVTPVSMPQNVAPPVIPGVPMEHPAPTPALRLQGGETPGGQ